MGPLPVGELPVPGLGQRDPRRAAVTGIGLTVDESGVQQLADQAAHRVRRQPLTGRQFADPQRLGGECLQQLDLGHGQGLPRVVRADAAPQRAAQAGDHIGETLDLRRIDSGIRGSCVDGGRNDG